MASITLPIASVATAPATHSSLLQKIVGAEKKFLSIMEIVAKDAEKGLTFAVKYAVPVEKLAALIFPEAAPELATVASATTLIQNAVLLVEQKYAASGAATGTGSQKAAEVMTLTESAVTTLLGQAGINVNSGYIQSLVNAVVAILNVQTVAA